jgi:hypothetical protein
MPLAQYGVAIGTLARFYRDSPDAFGRWYHGHVEVTTPTGLWTSALDVDTPFGLGVHYRILGTLQPSVLGAVANMPGGFQPLPSNATSGAIDYIRAPFLRDTLILYARAPTFGLPPIQPLPSPWEPGLPPIPHRPTTIPDSIREAILQLLARFTARLPTWSRFRIQPWISSNGDNALTALEAELLANRKVYLFGERFTSGNGVHDVHQNQGDPVGSQWYAQNGIWQDGAVAIERPDGSLFFWQVRFDSQATSTDISGHPA